MKYVVSPQQLTETVAPLVEPVSLIEMKEWLNVDTSDDDILIASLIKAGRAAVEEFTQRAMVRRTYRADIPCFADEIILPMPPLVSVSSFQYYNTDSPTALTAVDAADYRVSAERSTVYRSWGESWPARFVRHDAVQITYVAGYAPSTDSPITDHAEGVPEPMKTAVKFYAADLYQNREISMYGPGMAVAENPVLKAILGPYRNIL
jgi:uncharacterized phiE125 gp8 family phage protein